MTSHLIVVIPTVGKSELLERTLASLSDCARPANYGRTIVIENGPKGVAEQITRAAAVDLNVEYVHVERANKSNALNLVFERFEDSDLIYLVDDDIRFAANVLVDYANAAAGKNQGFVFGGPLRIDSELEPPAEYLDFLPGSMKGWEPSREDFDARQSYFLGANWAVFAGDVRRVGGFDPRFGPGSPLDATGQEWNMQMALRKAGVVFTYVPTAIVWHHVDFSRFSRDFLMKRRYRGGLEAGIQAVDRIRNATTLRDRVGYPAYRARYRLIVHGWLAKLYQFTAQPKLQLKHELLHEHARGFLESFHALRFPKSTDNS